MVELFVECLKSKDNLLNCLKFFFNFKPFYSNDMLNLSFDVKPTLSLSSYSFWKNDKTCCGYWFVQLFWQIIVYTNYLEFMKSIGGHVSLWLFIMNKVIDGQIYRWTLKGGEVVIVLTLTMLISRCGLGHEIPNFMQVAWSWKCYSSFLVLA